MCFARASRPFIASNWVTCLFRVSVAVLSFLWHSQWDMDSYDTSVRSQNTARWPLSSWTQCGQHSVESMCENAKCLLNKPLILAYSTWLTEVQQLDDPLSFTSTFPRWRMADRIWNKPIWCASVIPAINQQILTRVWLNDYTKSMWRSIKSVYVMRSLIDRDLFKYYENRI